MVAGSPQLQLMPMFHLAGLSQALQCLLTGGTLHVLPAFDATRVVDEIERNAIQFFTAAPTIIAALVDEVRGRPERPMLGSLREIQYGAAPMPEPLLRDAIDVLGCRFRQIYGMTEAQSFVSLLHPRDHVPGSPRLRTAGQMALGWEVRIVDHDRPRRCRRRSGRAADPQRCAVPRLLPRSGRDGGGVHRGRLVPHR